MGERSTETDHSGIDHCACDLSIACPVHRAEPVDLLAALQRSIDAAKGDDRG